MTTVLITDILITYLCSLHQNRINSPPFSPDILINRHSKPRVEAKQNKTPKNISVNTLTRLQTARPEFDYREGQKLLSLLRRVRTGSEVQSCFQPLNRWLFSRG